MTTDPKPKLQLHDVYCDCPECLHRLGGKMRVATIWSRDGQWFALKLVCDRCGFCDEVKNL